MYNYIKFSGLLASGFVIADEVAGKFMMLDKWQKCYENAGIEFQLFENEIEAQNWGIQNFRKRMKDSGQE